MLNKLMQFQPPLQNPLNRRCCSAAGNALAEAPLKIRYGSNSYANSHYLVRFVTVLTFTRQNLRAVGQCRSLHCPRLCRLFPGSRVGALVLLSSQCRPQHWPRLSVSQLSSNLRCLNAASRAQFDPVVGLGGSTVASTRRTLPIMIFHKLASERLVEFACLVIAWLPLLTSGPPSRCSCSLEQPVSTSTLATTLRVVAVEQPPSSQCCDAGSVRPRGRTGWLPCWIGFTPRKLRYHAASVVC